MKPIIFSTEMVKAILEGRKTQTRRVIKNPGYSDKAWGAAIPHSTTETSYKIAYLKVPYDDVVDNTGCRIICPYGQVGNRLWVREKYFVGSMTPCLQSYITLADMATIEPFVPADAHIQERGWHSPSHMPRWASRLTLEITEIRVGRLQEITYGDLKAEGMTPRFNQGLVDDGMYHEFITLWDSLNAKRGYGWEVNPWVWVIGFKRV